MTTPLAYVRRVATILSTAVVAALAAPPVAAQQAVPKAEVTAHPAIVSGRIVAPDKKGIEDVEVLLDDSVRAVTDRKGYFEIDPVPAGVHDVLVRKMGLVPVRFRVAVTAGDLWDGTIRMDRAAQALPAVVVLEASKALKNFRPPWIDGFVERRRLGLGTFLDRIDIEKSHLARTANLIARAPGVTTYQGFGYDELRSPRCGMGAGSKAMVFVDGIKMETSTNGRFVSLNDYMPAMLWGIEVFRGRGSIPPQYDDPQACLVILLWTNRR
ncbi:MAG: carboxypeptidase regulatory-like domain-containing protein [Gemmatimonadetes bacterium]|nr:carboxypeptidase regulatory-like domain-containing protein [Gemmatimonadota bacterium]